MNNIQNYSLGISQNVNFQANYLKQAKRVVNKPFNYLDNKIDSKLLTPYNGDFLGFLKIAYRLALVGGLVGMLNTIVPEKYNPEIKIDTKEFPTMLDSINQEMSKINNEMSNINNLFDNKK